MMDSDDFYGLESWEADYNLIDREDWLGLLKLREKRAKDKPFDLDAQQRYAEALNFNGRYSETLDFITPLYKKNFEDGFGINEILDALYGLGKTENDFNWINKPKILKLDKEAIKSCLDILKDKRKFVDIRDIYCDLLLDADYLKFSEQELGKYLIKFIDIFDIEVDKDFIEYSKLKIKKDKKR